MNTGIYLIENIVSGRRYVGSAVSIRKRWREHRRTLECGTHHSARMQRSYRKHGAEAFRFSVLLYCAPENLLMYEQRLLDAWKPEYNSAPVAGSQLGFRMSAESKAKLSAAAKRTKNFTGHRHSEESKRRISESRKGKGASGWTQQRRDKIGAAHKGRIISPEMRAKISASLTGTTTGRGLLTADQVRAVRALRADGFGKCRIAKQLGIPEHAADSVLRKTAYLWVA